MLVSEPSIHLLRSEYKGRRPTVVRFFPMESSAALEKVETSPTHASARKDKWLIAIGVFKLLKATLFFLLGVGAIRLLHKDIVDEVTRFIVSMRFDPEGRFVSLILDKVALI